MPPPSAEVPISANEAAVSPHPPANLEFDDLLVSSTSHVNIEYFGYMRTFSYPFLPCFFCMNDKISGVERYRTRCICNRGNQCVGSSYCSIWLEFLHTDLWNSSAYLEILVKILLLHDYFLQSRFYLGFCCRHCNSWTRCLPSKRVRSHWVGTCASNDSQHELIISTGAAIGTFLCCLIV